jgi:hypothetical protein
MIANEAKPTTDFSLISFLSLKMSVKAIIYFY